MAPFHVPVLSRQVLEHIAVRPEKVYLDCTAGLGGHVGQVAQQLTTGHVIANDRDAESLELAKENTRQWADRIWYHHGPFSRLGEALAVNGGRKVSGLLADLGVSRYQLTEAERGFSLQSDGPLDMRMDRGVGQSAAEILNYSSERELADLIYQLGEERRARRITRALIRARPLRSTGHVARVIEEAVPRMGKLHPATLTFMAIRRAVNDEVEELESLLRSLPRLVESGGRCVILTFMSLEDRQVKQGFQRLAKEGKARILTKHVVTPDDEEIRANPLSRSAKLRCIEMVSEEAEPVGD
ncbi:MAG: 16S rRNA (cytosine(1402)-N(4))-methyltransferase RsmH [Bryobacterales bacterium]|nr:16S rRNA (cytosine(1402)-N(4))-methyltransferase RsmH [Bryobacterales bacterium]